MAYGGTYLGVFVWRYFGGLEMGRRRGTKRNAARQVVGLPRETRAQAQAMQRLTNNADQEVELPAQGPGTPQAEARGGGPAQVNAVAPPELPEKNPGRQKKK